MKKFLSSLLALTMILSLVIVPANANDTPSSPANTEVTDGNQGGSAGGDSGSGSGEEPSEPSFQTQYQLVGTVTVSVTDDKTTVKGGENVTFTAENTVKVQKKTTENGEWEDTVSGDNVVITGKWSVNGVVNNSATEASFTTSWEAGQRDVTKTVAYTMTATVGGKAVVGLKSDSASVTVKAAPALTIKANDATVTDSNTVVEILKDGNLELTATSSGVSNPVYRWYEGSDFTNDKSKSSTYSVSTTTKTDSAITVTCKVYEGTVADDNLVKTATCKYQIVEEDLRWNVTSSSATLKNDSVTLTKKGETTTITAVLQKKSGSSWTAVDNATYSFELSKSGVATLSDRDANRGKVTVTLQDEGNVTLTVSTSYKGTSPSTKIKVNGELLKSSLKEVENGDKLEFDYDDLATLANKLLPTNVEVKSGGHITLKSYPTSASTGGTLYLESTKLKGASTDLSTDADLTFYAQAGYVKDANLELAVTGDNNQTYTVYVAIPVTSAGDIDETVTGSTANSNVSFKVKDVVSYDYLYVYGTSRGTSSNATFNPGSLSNSSTTGYDAYWSGASAKDGWVRFDDTDTITIPASEFSKSTGKVTLYVVGIDDDSVAYTGKITVSQKSYDIEYDVVAGKSVNFDQKAFEDFMDDYADDNISTSKGDYFEFDYVKFTLPSSTYGTLYDGSTKIKSSDEISNLDKVSFDSTTKAKGTINIPFTLYAKRYDKNDKVVDKKVTMSGNVAISVVNEDVTYTVGVNSSVSLRADDFLTYLHSVTGYKTAKIDYVKFDVKNASSYLYGGLYRTANGTLVDSKDSFYYSPSRNQYGLDDVTYATTRWSEAGKTVYIPFTIYTTSSSSKGVEGTLAITIAQTMNFTDVNPGDFFYQPVQWAVNEGITNGTSSTTFSPYKNCTRAEIVTFLWRAAKSPEPTITRNPFSDVNSVRDASYYKAILWASQNGITAGTTATTFSPYQECTRAQIVTFLYRYSKQTNTTTYNPFKDVSPVNEASYYNAILWAVNKGITEGTSTTTFSPYASCTRGQAVTFLYRYVNGVK